MSDQNTENLQFVENEELKWYLDRFLKLIGRNWWQWDACHTYKSPFPRDCVVVCILHHILWFPLHLKLFQITLWPQKWSQESSLCHPSSGLSLREIWCPQIKEQGFQNRMIPSLSPSEMVFCNQGEVDLWGERLNNLHLSFIPGTTPSCIPPLLPSLGSSWLLSGTENMEYHGGNVTCWVLNPKTWSKTALALLPPPTPLEGQMIN